MEEKLNALMLRGVDYKDNDKMLTLYSLERGLVSAGIKGVKKAGAKLKFASQPFCFAHIPAYGKYAPYGQNKTILFKTKTLY